jgi:hypothetical protein
MALAECMHAYYLSVMLVFTNRQNSVYFIFNLLEDFVKIGNIIASPSQTGLARAPISCDIVIPCHFKRYSHLVMMSWVNQQINLNSTLCLTSSQSILETHEIEFPCPKKNNASRYANSDCELQYAPSIVALRRSALCVYGQQACASTYPWSNGRRQYYKRETEGENVRACLYQQAAAHRQGRPIRGATGQPPWALRRQGPGPDISPVLPRQHPSFFN